MSSSTWFDSRTPSAAVGSSSTTTFDPNAAARATATAWRWPPERFSTGTVTSCRVEMPSFGELVSRLRCACLRCRACGRPSRGCPSCALFAAEVQVRRHVERGRDGEVLVDRLDAGAARILRALERHRLAVEEDLALVGDLGAGEALDQRRLSGTVVADDGEHLAGVELEAHAVEADDPTEGLDEACGLQDRRARLRRRERRVVCDGHLRTFRIHWSTTTATMMRMPTARV